MSKTADNHCSFNTAADVPPFPPPLSHSFPLLSPAACIYVSLLCVLNEMHALIRERTRRKARKEKHNRVLPSPHTHTLLILLFLFAIFHTITNSWTAKHQDRIKMLLFFQRKHTRLWTTNNLNIVISGCYSFYSFLRVKNVKCVLYGLYISIFVWSFFSPFINVFFFYLG